MDGDQMTEESQGILNQLRLDLLLRRLGTVVLRQKFKEIYARLNNGKGWTDGPEAGGKFCQTKWGRGAFVKANLQQQGMMKGGNIQNWDLHCLQSVITQMLTTALKDRQEGNNSKETLVNWDPRWDGQMSKIRQLANIRHSIAHMPNEILSQSEFDEKWDNAVKALKCLGAKSKEIKKILQMSQSALNPPGQGQQGHGSNHDQGQKEVDKEKKQINENPEESKIVEELRAKIEDLQLKIQVKSQDKIKNQDNNKVKDQGKNEHVKKVVVNKKNEGRADYLARKGDTAGRSGDWDQALKFYTQALEIPDISDDLRKKIYLNRSWIHLKVLQVPKFPLNIKFNHYESGEFDTKHKPSSKLPIPSETTPQRQFKFVDEKFLQVDHQNWPPKLTEELKEFHLTAGMADAESALQLSPGQISPTALYHLGQLHQLKGDWNSALTYFDLALSQSHMDSQLELDRNACQLQLLNQAEVEEFDWIPGKKSQTMAGVEVTRNPYMWSKIMNFANSNPEQKLYAEVVKAHFMAQGLPPIDQGQKSKDLEINFDQVVKLYEGAANLPSGIYNLGLLLQEGNGVHQADFFSAAVLFKMAANFPINDKTPLWKNEGVCRSQYRLGLCYEFGLGVGKDDKKALHWFEMASLGDFARASRRLGDIYLQGLLGVAKDEDMAMFFWEHARHNRDRVAGTCSAVHILQSPPITWNVFGHSFHNFSVSLNLNYHGCTPTMINALMDRKQHYQSVIATILEDLAHTKPEEKKMKGNEEREPEGVSWNIVSLVNQTLHTIDLLELAHTPEFERKLEAIPNWRKQFIFTDKLMKASKSCDEGLTALQKLNRLYHESLIIAGPCPEVWTDYPPNLRELPEVDQNILDEEEQLVAIVFESFATSIKLVGASYFRDLPTLLLVRSLTEKRFSPGSSAILWLNAFLLHTYFTILSEVDEVDEKGSEDFEKSIRRGDAVKDPLLTVRVAAIKGYRGKFEEVTGDMEVALKQLLNPCPVLHQLCNIDKLKCDLLFVQALCCKSAALTRGVNAANRKKVKEAMGIFDKFLSICPNDEPRRAETNYQLGLCTLYLEKMKVKGQVTSSTAKDILDKVLPHFAQGEAVEQEFPWTDFAPKHKSPVKLFLQRKMKELQNLSDHNRTLNLGGDSEKLESVSFGRLLSHFFKFPTVSFPLPWRAGRRVEVITEFRRVFKAACEHGVASPSLSVALQLPPQDYLLHCSPFGGVLTKSIILGCYEIVEPVLHFQLPPISIDKEHKLVDEIGVLTVVQDESGAVFSLQFIMVKDRKDEHKDDARLVGPLRMGARIIIHKPHIRLDEDGGTSLIVENVGYQIYHLPPLSEVQQENGGQVTIARKCGLCGKIGGKLQQCAKCQAVYYCGKECQKADWKELKHNWICPFLHPSSASTPSVAGI